MASTRKSRAVNKRFAKHIEESPEKDGGTANKSKLRKRKLSDMLGSQWSKEELERFYEAYRRYGRDWKKVAGAVRNRSVDMVEALYNMNRAYLSLPEGTATVAGLIAMMTDHYNILEGTDSERESNDDFGISRKPHKRGRGKFRSSSVSKGLEGALPDLLQCQSAPSYGCLPLLKKKRSGGSRPRAVGKRTPRFPVSYTCDKEDRAKVGSSNRHGVKTELDSDDDEVAHVVLALAGASQRAVSPRASLTPSKRAENMKPSSIQSNRRKHSEFETVNSKATGTSMDEDYCEGSLGSRGAENVEFGRDNESVGAVEISRKGKKFQTKKPKIQGFENNDHFDDVREACSGTEEGLTLRAVKDEAETEVSYEKVQHSSPQGSRKRSRQQYFEGESSVQVKEEKRSIDGDGKSNTPEVLSTNHQRDKSKASATKEKLHSPGADVVLLKDPILGKDAAFDVRSIFESKQWVYPSTYKMPKRRRKPLPVKMPSPNTEADNKSHLSESLKIEASVDEGKKQLSKAKRAGQTVPAPKQGKTVKTVDHSSSSADVGRSGTAIGEPPVQKASLDKVSLPTKQQSRRKMNLQRSLAPKELKPNENVGNEQLEKPSPFVHDRTAELKSKLSRCLSSELLRRWCVFEWFYSAIDYPWFAKNEFVAYLDFAQLSNLPSRLTRTEWGVIRSALGKPRRLSDQLLREERNKLEEYRENVRDTYAKLRAGVGEGLPTDLARPLSVGQRVIAWHPKTRELHDGSVLTVDRNKCRVQFDRHELGVELLLDIDCMPLNPLENMPEALRRQSFRNYAEPTVDGHPKEWEFGGSWKLGSGETTENADGLSSVPSVNYPINVLMEQAKGDTIDSILQAKAALNEAVAAHAAYGPCSMAQIQAREADIRALTDVARALDKKEALLKEIRNLHEEVSLNQKDESFRIQYAQVVTQLKNADDQVCAALLALRERNTFNGNSVPHIGRLMSHPLGPPGMSFDRSALFNQESGSHVVQILDSSRRKARAMVDIAMQAVSSLRQGESPDVKIGEALDSVDTRLCGLDTVVPAIRSFAATADHSSHGTLNQQDQTNACPSEPIMVDVKQDIPDGNDLQLPSELISSCVTTLLMIQTCTERQCPPGEVAQILESALKTLEPCCSQNLPIYADIQNFMGVIKTQILALIPTQNNVLPAELSTS
ncbi:protein ALWAYS EARLY 3-like isoform X2 [Aristolochia californica]|uniref:protein ALWAYS EARLY 3-like isoform X2 n=1 Tax=Aristolochia californica TaxID=171875 RepID=UPI0035D79315